MRPMSTQVIEARCIVFCSPSRHRFVGKPRLEGLQDYDAHLLCEWQHWDCVIVRTKYITLKHILFQEDDDQRFPRIVT